MPLSADSELRAKQLANLHPPKTGDVRNPNGHNGRPIRHALMNEATGERCKKLSNVVWREALKGRPWAVTFLAERLEGKAEQPITGKDGQPISFTLQIGQGVVDDDTDESVG